MGNQSQFTLNDTAVNLLNDFSEKDGIYYSTIDEYEELNLGTKVLYLERAISENCKTFNESLDKLYGSEGVENIELIRALKFINDICFNTSVKFAEHGLKSAIVHWFESISGQTLNEDEIKKTIQLKIEERIKELSEGNQEKVAAEKEARILTETPLNVSLLDALFS